jgi:hypothetical protein
MNKLEIIFVSLGAIGIIIGSGVFGVKQFYKHSGRKPSDYSNKTKQNILYNIVSPDPVNPVKFNSEKWTLPSRSHHAKMPSSGGKKSTRRRRH